MSDAIEAIVYSVTANETKAHGLVRKVTLILPNDGDHPFQGMTGQRIAIACARIHDNEKQTAVAARHADGGVPHAPVKGGDKPGPKRAFNGLPRSQQAAIKCGDGDFQWFLGSNPEDADSVLKGALGITSKRELDTDPEAAKRWDALLTEYLDSRLPERR